MTIFNNKNVDHTKEYMFFGESLNVARYDKQRHPKFDHFVEQQLGYFWRPNEVNISADINDFRNRLTENEQRVFIANLQYQTVMDSVQGRSPVEVLGPICSLPELENWLVAWAFEETIHSRSYTHIIRNVFDDPSKIFDDIMITPEILARAGMVTKYYEDLAKVVKEGRSDYYAKEKLFDCVLSVHILEAIRFYVSFACSFSFAERGLMEGNAKIITLITRAEYLHQGATHYMLTRWTKGLDDPDLTKIAREKIGNGSVVKMFNEVYEQECGWIDYLFKDGSIPGLNDVVLKLYLNFLSKKALDSLDVKQNVFTQKDNPLPWMSKYTNAGSVQLAPQESELSSYVVGGLSITDDLDGIDFDI